jgi:hypothetical protein
MAATDKSYQFFINHDLAEYAGKWVAIVDEEVVASGDNAKVVQEAALRKYPDRLPLLAKIPKDEILVL